MNATEKAVRAAVAGVHEHAKITSAEQDVAQAKKKLDAWIARGYELRKAYDDAQNRLTALELLMPRTEERKK